MKPQDQDPSLLDRAKALAPYIAVAGVLAVGSNVIRGGAPDASQYAQTPAPRTAEPRAPQPEQAPRIYQEADTIIFEKNPNDVDPAPVNTHRHQTNTSHAETGSNDQADAEAEDRANDRAKDKKGTKDEKKDRLPGATPTPRGEATPIPAQANTDPSPEGIANRFAATFLDPKNTSRMFIKDSVAAILPATGEKERLQPDVAFGIDEVTGAVVVGWYDEAAPNKLHTEVFMNNDELVEISLFQKTPDGPIPSIARVDGPLQASTGGSEGHFNVASVDGSVLSFGNTQERMVPVEVADEYEIVLERDAAGKNVPIIKKMPPVEF